MHPLLATALADEQHKHAEATAAELVRAQDKGLVDPRLDPHALALMIMGLGFGLILGDLDTHRPIDPDRWQALMDHVIDKVITGHAPPRADR